MIADRTYHLVIINGVQSYVYYPNLTTIEINGGAAFYPSAYYAPNLTTFVVSEDFCSYGVIDGVLYGDFRSDGRYVVAYPAGLPGTVARFSGYVANNPLMKGNKIEKLYTAQNYLYPNSYSQNNDNLTDIYFTNKDMFVVEETDQIWSENSFANREKVTIHGYK